MRAQLAAKCSSYDMLLRDTTCSRCSQADKCLRARGLRPICSLADMWNAGNHQRIPRG